MSVILYLCSMSKGRIKYVNKAMYESLGYTSDEMLGRSILDFHTKKGAERVKIRLKLATPTSHGTYKTEYVCKDGTMIPVSARGKAIELGGTQYILAVARRLDPHDAPIYKDASLRTGMSEMKEQKIAMAL